MKTLNYFFYIIIFVSISILGHAQENSTMKDTQDPKVQDMQRKYNRYLDVYLAVLSADERKVLFASYRRGMSEEYVKQYTSEEESAYQSRIRKWDAMTASEREDTLRGKGELAEDRFIEIEQAKLTLSVLTEIWAPAGERDQVKEMLELFSGQPIYIVRRGYKRTDGTKAVSTIRVVLQRTLADIWGIQLAHSG